MTKDQLKEIIKESLAPVAKEISEIRETVAPSGQIGNLIEGIKRCTDQLSELKRLKSENAAVKSSKLSGVFGGLATIGEHEMIDPNNPFKGVLLDPTRRPISKGETDDHFPNAMESALANPEALKTARNGSDLEDSTMDIFFSRMN